MPPEEPQPRMPAGLGAAGKSIWKRLNSELEFSAREVIVLEQACRVADTVAILEALIEREGTSSTGSRNQARLNPALSELRQSRLTLLRLLSAIDVPDGAEVPRTAASRRAQRAADVRWGRPHAVTAHG